MVINTYMTFKIPYANYIFRLWFPLFSFLHKSLNSLSIVHFYLREIKQEEEEEEA